MMPPLRPNTVQRSRLILHSGPSSHYPLLVIVAPPGFGKTTLAIQEVHDREPDTVAWFSVDQDDNDPYQFLRYITAALQSVDERIGNTALELLQSRDTAPFKHVVSSLINDILRHHNPVTLVIDDYHEIDSAEVHDAMSFLLDHQPSNLHVVIATRIDPPFALARLRARGQLIEIRASDLRFTDDEAAAFLAGMGLALASEDLHQLEARTEGWIAGIQMAAVSLQGRDDQAIHNFITAFSGSHRHILDYLVDEVLQRQTSEVQLFLSTTSILDRLTAPLCDCVTQRTDSQATLDYLDHANLFLIQLDEVGEWYRYHHLFADVLRFRLQKSDPQAVAAAHRRASEWFQQNGFLGEAISHAIAANDIERAKALVETASRDMWVRRDMISVRGWLRALPASAIWESAPLLLLDAQIKEFQGWWPEVERLVSRAYELLSANIDIDPILHAEAATLRAMLDVFLVDPAEGLERSRQAVGAFPVTHPLRGTALLNLGIAQWLLGTLDDAIISFRATQQSCFEMGNIYQAQVAMAYEAETHRLQGRLHESEHLYQSALDLTPERLELPDINGLLIGLGSIALERNDIEMASDLLTRGTELGEQEENMLVVIAGLLLQGYLAYAQGNLPQSKTLRLRAVDTAERHRIRWLWTIPSLAAAWTQLAVLQGDLAAASRWADLYVANSAAEPALRHEAKQIALARVYIARDEYEMAGPVLNAVIETARVLGHRLHLMRALALRALVQKNQELSFRALEEALEIAEPEGFVRLFVDEGEPMRLRLERYLASRPESRFRRYVHTLLRAFAGISVSLSAEAQPLHEPLSERELEILSLMASGLSNADIAQRLYLSIATVKKHGTNIFGKLEADGRHAAIARARDLRLIR